eukprot:5434967-Pyramimonas_sp.AAC.1
MQGATVRAAMLSMPTPPATTASTRRACLAPGFDNSFSGASLNRKQSTFKLISEHGVRSIPTA